MSIPFTQYLLPNGRKKTITIDRSPYIEAKARRLRNVGAEFTAEILRTGEVSMCCVLNDEDVGIEVVPNGEDVPVAVDALIDVVYTKLLTVAEVVVGKYPAGDEGMEAAIVDGMGPLLSQSRHILEELGE